MDTNWKWSDAPQTCTWCREKSVGWRCTPEGSFACEECGKELFGLGAESPDDATVSETEPDEE
mgnify:CR=1 FL=1